MEEEKNKKEESQEKKKRKSNKEEQEKGEGERKKEEREEMMEMRKALEECQKEKEEYLNGWKRARADFLNYKKDEMVRIKEAVEREKENIILQILSILDDFETAEEEMMKREELKNNEWAKGILKIRDRIKNFLNSLGVEEIKAIGKEFDPYFHEAIEIVKKEGVKSEMVVEEVRKGYKIKDKVIRPAKVKVAK